MGQFSELESQISRSTHFTESERHKAIRQIRNVSAFLQPERMIRPWPEVISNCFKAEKFGFEFMRASIALEFPINSLAPKDIETLIQKITEAISDITVKSGAPPIVVATLTNALNAVLQILRHFKFYGAEALQKELAYAFTTASALERPEASEETRQSAHTSIVTVAAVAIAILTGSNNLIHAVEDWSQRGSAVVEYIASHSPQLLLPAPEAILPKEIEHKPPKDGDADKSN